jgi:hypothetical protein
MTKVEISGAGKGLLKTYFVVSTLNSQYKLQKIYKTENAQPGTYNMELEQRSVP